MKGFTIQFLLLLLFGESLLAQQRYQQQEPVIQNVTLYYNGAAELTSASSKTLTRVAEMNLNAMVFHGVYQDFDLKGNLIAEGYFNEGHKRGLKNEYFPGRALKSTIDYGEHDFVIWQLKNESKEDQVVNGSGKFTLPFFYGTGTTLQPRWKQGLLEGEFQFGKRIGVWNYFDLAKNKLDEEVYENGKFVNRVHYENGATMVLDYPKEIVLSLSTLLEEVFAVDAQTFTNVNSAILDSLRYPANFSRPPTFAGGLKRLLFLIAQRVALPDNLMLTLKVAINEKGLLTTIVVEQSVSGQVDAVAVNLIRSLDKKFFPAIRKGKPVSGILYLTVFGGSEGMKLIEELPYDFVQQE